jgi:hypothetical protein
MGCLGLLTDLDEFALELKVMLAKNQYSFCSYLVVLTETLGYCVPEVISILVKNTEFG